jgi:hypothetical protein
VQIHIENVYYIYICFYVIVFVQRTGVNCIYLIKYWLQKCLNCRVKYMAFYAPLVNEKSLHTLTSETRNTQELTHYNL